jgi:hypothetical protein
LAASDGVHETFFYRYPFQWSMINVESRIVPPLVYFRSTADWTSSNEADLDGIDPEIGRETDRRIPSKHGA